MKRVIVHWTAGVYEPNATDLEHYHYLIDSNGEVVSGKHKVEDNENCNDGNYAQHTGGGNTGSIGVAMCGMLGFQNSKNVGKYPLTKKQCEATFKLIAELAKKYNLEITPKTVMTHYEFGRLHPSTSSAGKIDISFIPYLPKLSPNEIGDFIRNKAQYYYEKL